MHLYSFMEILMVLVVSLVHTVEVCRGRELTGCQRFSSINPVSNYQHMRLHRRILGHLSAVYCIAFDRAGLRIFTVSLNYVFEIWQFYELTGLNEAGSQCIYCRQDTVLLGHC